MGDTYKKMALLFGTNETTDIYNGYPTGYKFCPAKKNYWKKIVCEAPDGLPFNSKSYGRAKNIFKSNLCE